MLQRSKLTLATAVHPSTVSRQKPSADTSVLRQRQSILGALLFRAVLAWLCVAFPPGCLGQTARPPSSSLFAVDQGTLTLYTTFSQWTGYWTSNITLPAGRLFPLTGMHIQAHQGHLPSSAPSHPVPKPAAAGQVIPDNAGLYWSPPQDITFSLGPASSSSIERIRETPIVLLPARAESAALPGIAQLATSP